MPLSDRYLLDPTGRPVRWTGMSERDIQAAKDRGYEEVSRSKWKQVRRDIYQQGRAA